MGPIGLFDFVFIILCPFHQNIFHPFLRLYHIQLLRRFLMCITNRIFFKQLDRIKIRIQWNLDLRKPDLRKNLDLRKIVGTTNFLVHNLFDLKKIFKAYCLI